MLEHLETRLKLLFTNFEFELTRFVMNFLEGIMISVTWEQNSKKKASHTNTKIYPSK